MTRPCAEVRRHRPGVPSLPGRCWAGQTRYALREFWRTPVSAFFTLVFPLSFLVILSAMYGNEVVDPDTGLRLAQYTTPVFAVFGTCMACYMSLGIAVAYARASGVLKRLRGTPLPPGLHIAGRVCAAVLVSALAVAIMVGVGVVFYDVQIITENVPALVLTFLVGAACFSALGLAVASVAPTPNAASAFANASLILLSFISGIFGFGQLPEWMDRVASVFPLKPFVEAFSDGFNPYVDASTPDWGALGVMTPVGHRGGRDRVALVQLGAPLREAGHAWPAPGRRRGGGRRGRTRGGGFAPGWLATGCCGRAPSRGRGSSRRGRPDHRHRVAGGAGHRGPADRLRDDADPPRPDVAVLLRALPRAPGHVLLLGLRRGGDLGRAAPAAVPGGGVLGVRGRDLRTGQRARVDRGASHPAHAQAPAGHPDAALVLHRGRILAVVVFGLLTVVLVFTVAVAFFSVTLPPSTWAATLLVFTLTICCFAACGLALVALVDSPQAVIAMSLSILLPLSFISDIFIQIDEMPTVLNAIGWFFPLRHAVHAAVTATSGGALDADFWVNLGVIVLWMAATGLAAWRFFRWEPRQARSSR